MNTRHLLPVLLLAAAVPVFADVAPAPEPTPFDKMALKGRTDKDNPVGYAVNEPIVFTLRTEDLDAIPGEGYQIKWTRTGDDGITEKGSAPLALGTVCAVTTRLDRAGFVRLFAQINDPEGKVVRRATPAPGSPSWSKSYDIFFDGGAGVDIGNIRQAKPEPPDFDAFWTHQKAELDAVPIEAKLTAVTNGVRNGFDAYAVSIACAGPRPVTGYLVVPHDAAPRSCKARIAFQGYGTSVQSCPGWAGQPGQIFLEINAHGYEFGHDKAYYDEFFAGIRTPQWSYAFSPDENARPETAYFRGMALRVMRALQYLKSRPEWNGHDLIAEGGSQGGLQTSWAAGLDPDVSLARPSVTWGCDLGFITTDRLHGGWHIPWAEGLGYFDAVNHIRRAHCPVEITRAGLGDYTCPPSTLAVYYNAIPGEKSVKWVQGSRHGFVPVGENQVVTLGTHHQTEGESKAATVGAGNLAE